MTAVEARAEPRLRTPTALWAVGLVGLAGFAMACATGEMRSPTGQTALIVVYGAAAASVLGSLAIDRGRRRDWGMLLVGLACYGASAAAYTLANDLAADFPSIADVGLFAFYPALAVVAVLRIRHESRWHSAIPWLDGAIAAATAACVGALVLMPATADAGTAGDGRLAYALADALLLGGMVGAWHLGGWRRGGSLRAMAAGVALLLAGDAAFAVAVGDGHDIAGALPALTWAGGVLALAAAPLLARERPAPLDDPTPVWLPLLCSITVVPIALASDGRSMPLVLVLACLALALVAVRFARTAVEHSRLMERARADAAFSTAINESLGEGLLAVGRDGRVTMANPAAERLLGRTEGELEGQRAQLLLPGIDEALHSSGRISREIDAPLGGGQGGSLPVLCTVAPFRDERGGGGHVIVLTDVSAHRQAEEGLLRRAAEHAVVARLGARALEGAGLEELTAEASQALARMLRLPHAAVGEYDPEREEFRLLAGHGLPARARARTPIASSGEGRVAFEASKAVVTPDLAGSPEAPPPFLADMHARAALTVPLPGPDHPIGALTAFGPEPRHFTQADVDFAQSVANVLADAISNMRREERIRHDALHDPLTGLGNRTLLTDRVSHLLSQRRQASVAVLFVDVDRFKQINDSLGHAVGDELLYEIGGRLTDTVRPGDTVARLGGDEFIVLCEGLPDAAAAADIAERVCEAVGVPFLLREQEVVVSASIGISWWDGDAEGEVMTPDALIGEADLAMYRAKQAGRNRIELFEPSLRDGAVARLALESDLRHAIDRDQLTVHYQPVVRLVDGVVIGAEALVRWNHPARGMLYPGEFIPLAEESGLIVELGAKVLREACRAAANWPHEPSIAVNISARQLADPGLGAKIGEALAESGLAPRRLILEITETAVATAAAIETLRGIKRLGVRLAIDDFGVGFSSLSQLKSLPQVDMLKIDRSFIAGLPGDHRDQAVVTAAIELGRTLGAEVVGEGIENAGHAGALVAANCEFGQGFHFGHPAPDERPAPTIPGAQVRP